MIFKIRERAAHLNPVTIPKIVLPSQVPLITAKTTKLAAPIKAADADSLTTTRKMACESALEAWPVANALNVVVDACNPMLPIQQSQVWFANS